MSRRYVVEKENEDGCASLLYLLGFAIGGGLTGLIFIKIFNIYNGGG